MDQSKQNQEGERPRLKFGDISKSVRSRPGVAGSNRLRWEPQPEKLPPRHDDSGDESEPHEPQVVQLNLKSSLMGVRILDDDDERFFSRQSSMSSMLSEKFRSSAAHVRPSFKWEAERRSKPVGDQQSKTKIDIPSSNLMFLQSSRGSSARSLFSQPDGNDPQPARIPSELLYSYSPNQGSRPNSFQLDAGLFTFDSDLLTPEHHKAGTSGGDDITERMFQKLVGQSRLHESCRAKRAGGSSGNLDTTGDDLSVSPVSTLDVPQSPTSSERSFRGASKRKSLRRRSEDANSLYNAAQVDSTDQGPSSAPGAKSHLAQFLMSIPALTEDIVDNGDLEGPSEVAWLEPEDVDNPFHPDLPVVEGCSSAHGKSKKPTHERWSSNSSSWNLSLVQHPLRTVSTIVRRQHGHHATVPGRSSRKENRRGKPDGIMSVDLTASYDGRVMRKGARSELSSARSWWPELGSGRRSSVFASSGRLHMEVAAEPDLHEPDMEQANNVKYRQEQGHARVKDDEDDFPFDNPVASSFVFQEARPKFQSSAHTRKQSDTQASLHGSVISVIDSENDELLFSDNYHDPEDGSLSDSDGSHYSLGREGQNGLMLDPPPHWVSSRSVDLARDIVDIGFSGRNALGEFSGRDLSWFIEIRREMGISGRFSVDLQRGQKLDKAHHPRTPDVRLRIFKPKKPSKRFSLSPCLPFLHRSHNKHVPRINQAPAERGASNRRLQPVNSFTARLGPAAENSELAGQFQLQ